MKKFLNEIDTLWTFIGKPNNLFNLLVFPLIVGLILIIIPFLYNNIRKYIGEIEITKESFINVPKTVNGEEIISNDKEVLENYVQSKLIIENNKFSTTIHKLALTDVIVKPYHYVDLVIQNGFDNNTQIVSFYRFNNGTQISNTKKYKVEIKYHNSIDNTTKIIEKKLIAGKDLKSGEIETLLKVDVLDPRIKSYFKDSIPDYKQDIEIRIYTEQEESKIAVPYLSSIGKFNRNLGGIGVPIDKPIVPVLELTAPYQKDYHFIIDQTLLEGKNYLKFNILVDKASLITYNYSLFNDKEKVILSKKQKEPIQIRFPQYKLLSPYGDDIYYYMIVNNLEESNIDEVKFRKPSLVNSINKTKVEYNLQK